MTEIPEKYQNAIDVCGNQKVMKLILKESSTPTVIPKGVKCKLHYTGTLLDGTKFDSSVDRNQPFETEIGIGRVIKGWDEVVPSMKIGEKASVLIQADYAYGEHGSPPTIPGNSPLIFEIELLDVYGEDISVEKNKGLTKLLVSRGRASKLPTKDQDDMEKDAEGPIQELEEYDDMDDPNDDTKPDDGTNVVIDITKFNLKTNEILYFGEDLNICVGEEQLNENLNIGVRYCIKSMRMGEKSKFTCVAGTKYNSEKDNIEYTISLKNVTVQTPIWELSPQQIVDRFEQHKARGGELYKQGHDQVALNKYNMIHQNMENYTGDDEAEEEKELYNSWQKLKIAALSNAALINLKMNNSHEALRNCNEVLEMDGDNEKALFRQGQAFLKQMEIELAIRSFNMCLKINGNNKAAKNELVKCKKAKKDAEAKEKQLYAKMFA